MRFDWQRFCSEYRISFVTDGPNTKKGEISIQCPWCGTSDESQHLGLSLNPNNPVWACWRSREHRGKSPAYLVAKLIGIEFKQALTLVQTQQKGNPDSFEAAVASLAPQEKIKAWRKKTPLAYPTAFHRFDTGLSTEKRFINYLKVERGFGEDWKRVVAKYDLRWSVVGEYAHRVIVPIYHDGGLATWTARAITKAFLRYKTVPEALSQRIDKECLLLPPARLNVPRSLLVVTEGPFDAMKVETFGAHLGISAVCVFGLVLSNTQLEMLKKLRKRYRQVVVLLDQKEVAEADRMVDEIHEVLGGSVVRGTLPKGVKDPGELSRVQVESVVKSLLKGV